MHSIRDVHTIILKQEYLLKSGFFSDWSMHMHMRDILRWTLSDGYAQMLEKINNI